MPLYDNTSSVCGIVYDDTPFYFQKNLQGDIIEIVDKNAEVVAKYSYDAWGACTILQDSSDCHIASLNPYRYRGYYYDAEIGLYYLQSRYYDPGVGRFINADEMFFIFSKFANLFSYCHNNILIYADYWGFASVKIGKEAVREAGDIFLYTKSCPISQMTYNYAFRGQGRRLPWYECDKIEEKLKKTPAFMSYAKSLLRSARAKGLRKISEVHEFDYDDDLFYTFQHATVTISRRIHTRGEVDIVYVDDRYDFDKYRRIIVDGSVDLANIANNLGRFLQCYEYIQPYDIHVAFTLATKINPYAFGC